MGEIPAGEKAWLVSAGEFCVRPAGTMKLRFNLNKSGEYGAGFVITRVCPQNFFCDFRG
jgi:hypothetical protein